MSVALNLVEYAEQSILDLYKSVSWRTYELWTRRYRNAVQRKLRKFFNEQEVEVISNILPCK